MNQAKIIENLKKILMQYIVFMLPAMLISAKGFADIWVTGQQQPYTAATLLLLSTVMALLFLTMASAFLFISHRQFWIPPGKLILLTTGMILYFDFSLGKTIGLAGLAAPVALWAFWGLMAYHKNRSALERS